jgi:hypothetical protein
MPARFFSIAPLQTPSKLSLPELRQRLLRAARRVVGLAPYRADPYFVDLLQTANAQLRATALPRKSRRKSVMKCIREIIEL